MTKEPQISVGFSRSRGLVSRVIRWLSRGDVSHTFFIVSDSFLGEDMVLQADFRGFEMITLRAFTAKNLIVHSVPLAHPVHVGIRKAAANLGRAYDYQGALGAAVVLVGEWLKQKWKNPWRSSRLVFCWESVVRVLQASDYPESGVLDPSSTTPKALLAFLLSGGSSK